MLANFFGKSKPITSIMLLLLFLSYSILAYFNDFSVNFYSESSVLAYFRYTFLVFSTFFIYKFITVKNNLTFDNSYAFLFFIICLGLIPETFLTEKTIFLNLIIFLFLRKVYSLQSSKKVLKKVFDGGFWLGIGFIIEPFLAIFLLFFYIAIYVHKKITVRTLILPIIGFIIPVFLYFTYTFWNDNTTEFFDLFNWISNYNSNTYTSISYLIPIILISVFLLFSVFVKTPKAFSVKNTFRKNWILILLNLLTCIILVLLLKNNNGSELLFLFFPVSIILANGLETISKTLIKDIIIAVFLLASFILFHL